MTPKEKAKELVHKMINIDSDSDMFDGFIMKEFYAQRAALIAVDEILLEHFGDTSDYGTRRYYYFQEVKQEIEKL